MNAKGDANRSVRMTKQRLYQALITLLQQKSLREITVRELTELAGISRGTVYFHYADIYALMDTLIPSISQEDAPPALVALFTYMTENPDLCQALYGKSWESEFTRNAKKLIAERCLGEFAPDGGTEEQKYMLAFAVNGCFGTIVAWQEAGFQPPAAEIARITWQAIRAVKGRM